MTTCLSSGTNAAEIRALDPRRKTTSGGTPHSRACGAESVAILPTKYHLLETFGNTGFVFDLFILGSLLGGI